jgi:hypothetical protein
MRYGRHWSTRQWEPPPNSPYADPSYVDGYEQLELFDLDELTQESKMGKVEKRSADPGFFAKGGTGKMFGKGGADESNSGQSGKESQGSANRDFPKGGTTKMFGKGSAGKKIPGISGKASQEG